MGEEQCFKNEKIVPIKRRNKNQPKCFSLQVFSRKKSNILISRINNILISRINNILISRFKFQDFFRISVLTVSKAVVNLQSTALCRDWKLEPKKDALQ